MTEATKNLTLHILKIIGLVVFFVVFLLGPSIILVLLLMSKGGIAPFATTSGGLFLVQYLGGLIVYALGIFLMYRGKVLYTKVLFWYSIVAVVVGLVGLLAQGGMRM